MPPSSEYAHDYRRLYLTSALFGLAGTGHMGMQLAACNALGPVLKPYFNESLVVNFDWRPSEMDMMVGICARE